MIFTLDCEFNGFEGELISLALVAENESYLYLVYNIKDKVDPWVRSNVLPKIGKYDPIPSGKANGAASIKKFLEEHSPDETPIIVCDWPDDIKYFCEALLLGPGQMINIKDIIFRMIRFPPELRDLSHPDTHNPVHDAKCLMKLLQDS